MRHVLTASILTAVTVLMASPGAGQSVAEAARREKERRAKQEKATPAKVYTDADLAAGRPPGEPAPPAAAEPKASDKSTAPADPAPAPTEPAVVDDGEAEARERKRLEAEWRIRFADTRRRISEAEARCWTREVQTVFVAGIPVQQWVPVFYESEELRQRKRDLVDLEEEYRKTGLPPGWVRD